MLDGGGRASGTLTAACSIKKEDSVLASFRNRRVLGREPRTIRFQLLLTVNVILGTAIVGLLVLRYTHEMKVEAQKKHANLNDEAIAIHAAVNHLWQDHDTSAVQSYINSVCEQMRASTSPCHHIVLQRNRQVLQAQAHADDDPQIVSAIESASRAKNHQSVLGDHVFVAGSHTSNGISVYVSEDLDNVRRAIRRDLLLQLAVAGLLGAGTAGIVSFLLLRIVREPLQRLLMTVDQISDGKFGTEARSFGSREMQELSSAINSMSRCLLESDSERHQQMVKAQQIQQHLLPNDVKIPDLLTAHVFEPADVVAGDYYDFLQLTDGSWLICLADVTGHGIPAAMGAAMLKSLLIAASESPPFDPVSILEEVNRHFAVTVLPGNFASMFLGRWEPKSRELSWASAGHEPGLLLTQTGHLDQLQSTGLLLGIQTGAVWDLRSVTLSAGDRILLFSDGATETLSPESELFGRDRLSACFSRWSELSPQTTLNRITGILGKHRGERPLNDDLTLVVMECRTHSVTVGLRPKENA